jgi:ribosome biogenesis GTPase
MTDLKTLGWSESFAATFAPFAARGCVPARVAVQQRGQYLLYTDRGELRGEAAGKIHYTARGSDDFPAVGDWVAVKATGSGDRALIEGILPRKTEFSRKVPGNRTAKQVLASNIDVVFLVSGLDGDFNVRRLERYLVLAKRSGAMPVVLLNKADLLDDPADLLHEAEAVARGAQVVLMSARTELGFDTLRSHLGPGITGALLGSSGVGKSTILNRLLGEERFRTQEVRESDSRGRHTTARRELVLIPSGGLLIDTPGMRELQLWDEGEGVQASFDDIEQLALRCKFTDCRHENEPGCAVRQALEDGSLEEDRLEGYRKLMRELGYQARKTDRPSSIAEKKRWKKITKDFRKWNKKK